MRSLSEQNFSDLVDCLNNISWLPVYFFKSANVQFENFFELFICVINMSLPLENVKNTTATTQGSSAHKWFTPELASLKSEVEKFSYLSRNSSCPKI